MVKNSSLRYCILLKKKIKVPRTLVKLTKIVKSQDTSKSFECCLEMLHFSTFSFFVTVYYSYTFGLHLIKSNIYLYYLKPNNQNQNAWLISKEIM